MSVNHGSFADSPILSIAARVNLPLTYTPTLGGLIAICCATYAESCAVPPSKYSKRHGLESCSEARLWRDW